MSKSFPKALKPILPYLQRANEFQKRAPLVAYYCRTYAVQIGIGIIQSPQGKGDQEATNYIMELMDRLENEKKDLNPNSEEGRAIVELFALKIFKKADDADRAGRHDKTVAKLFYASSILMNCVKLFGELSEDMLEKQKYARWKAAEINRALQTGDKISSGPYEKQTKDELDTTSFEASFKPMNPSFEEKEFTQPTIQPTTQSTTQSEDKELNDFMNELKKEIQSENMMDTSKQIDPTDDPFYQPPPQNQPPRELPKVPPPKQETTHLPPKPTSKPTQPKQNVSQQSFSSYQQPQQPVQTSFQQPQYEEPPRTQGKKEPSMEDIANAQKYTKFATSALQFQDVPTAIKYLKQALSLLE